MLQEPNKKRRKIFQELAAKHPTVLVDIYQAETSSPPDSPQVRPDTVPMDIWACLGYEDHSNAYMEEIKEEIREQPCIQDRKGKGIMKNQ
ncbi:hypothetical protein C5167_003930 [Papaver somniferum]|nr:hypothetical protein C5167_003930 [Papaver somniferum]